jgi:hypothetical protein
MLLMYPLLAAGACVGVLIVAVIKMIDAITGW